MQLGSFNDQIVPGDYDGDGKADRAVWRPTTGRWSIVNSSNGTQTFQDGWGVVGDIPVPADYVGDRKTDFAVWRPSNGIWYILQSYNGTETNYVWGLSGDVPIPSAYNRY